MPELPEVETVCRGIAPFIEGERLHDVHLHRANLRIPFPELMAERIGGLSVDRVYRIAKYVVVALSDGQRLVIHLGMSGQIKMAHDFSRYELLKHDHMVLLFGDADQQDQSKALIYNDPRRFGMVMLFDDEAALKASPSFVKMGPDPFDPAFDVAEFARRLSAKSGIIKSALLDQHLIAGLGNIYVCEALFMSGTHPERSAQSLNKVETASLYDSINVVLRKAIDAGGSTLKDFRQADGKLGYFQNELLVYGREEAPCYECCKAAIQRIVQAGRSTFFCPQCQKIAKVKKSHKVTSANK
jgi:formamidopyrimidine-DNA glycosylase